MWYNILVNESLPSCKKCGEPRIRTQGGRLKCRPCERAYQLTYYYAHPLQKERKRLDMAYRRTIPELNERLKSSGRKAYASGGYEKQRQRVVRKKEQFFPWKVQFARRSDPSITVTDIQTMWDQQGGLCALTGRPLGPDAQLDHVLPLARGGSRGLANLRWVCPQANYAKRDLTDEEYLTLCRDSIEYIGARIMAALRRRAEAG